MKSTVRWFRQLESLVDVRVPRCLREPKNVAMKRVITFVDASLKVYGAVVFFQCEYDDATVSSRMITLKNKVAPLKPRTVPRLELIGAILVLRLTQNLMRIILEIPMNMVTFFSDSTDVLWWTRFSLICRKPCRWETDVNRTLAMATRSNRSESGWPMHKRSYSFRIIRVFFMVEWTEVGVRR